MPYELYREAEQALDRRLVPGKDQDAIRSGLDTVARAMARLRRDGSPQAIGCADTLCDRLQDLQDQAIRHLLHPRNRNALLRQGLQEICAAAERIRSGEEQRIGGGTGGTRLLVRRESVAQERALQSLGVASTSFTHIPYDYLSCPTTDLASLSAELQRGAVVASPEKTYRIRPCEAQGERLWNLELVGAAAAWERTRGEGIAVAVADSGCDYRHPELADRFGPVKGYDFVNDDADPRDDNGHGTHVSGTVAGKDIGVAPGCTLYALKFLDMTGSGYEVDFIRAAEWAIDNGVQVLNGSFGSRQSSAAEQAVCEALAEHGVLFVAAAGNSGGTEYSYPASYPTVLSVAAVDRHKRRAPFSQRNDAVGISGPGVDIRSAVPGGYDTYSGTSMATPHVAGAAALLLSQNPDPRYVRELLRESAERLGEEREYGTGLVRPDLALRMDAFVRRWAA